MKKKLEGGEGVDQVIEANQLFPTDIRREETPSSGRSTPVQRKGSPAPKVAAAVPGEDAGGTVSVEATKVEEKTNKIKQEEEGPSTSGLLEPNEGADEGRDDEPLITEADLEQEEVEDQCVIDYRHGSYSTKLFSPTDIDDKDAVIYVLADDMKKLELAGKQVKSTRVRLDKAAEFVQKAQEGIDDDEAQFSVQHELEKQSFLWSDKYRPRKPMFFNRVHTGFEWNKYNQTHYDIDNPPQKIVQRYKSNDIAFKIVNKEWEHSYKRSFRCQFANNIMQLWFHFKRERYRR